MSQSAGSPRRWISVAQSTTSSCTLKPAAFNAEPDPAKRGALWGKVQQVIHDEVPYIRAGNFGALSGTSAKMNDYAAMPWPSFWNVGLAK